MSKFRSLATSMAAWFICSSANVRCSAALHETVLHGVTSNLDFLQAILAHPAFTEGRIHTRWVEADFDWKSPSLPTEALIAAALAGSMFNSRQVFDSGNSMFDSRYDPDPFSPWKSGSGFRN